MSESKKSSELGDLSAYERWELPAFAGGAPARANAKRSAKATAKLPTAGELEAIRKSAYDEGFTQGQGEGFAQGKKEGQAQGLKLGKQEGLAQGLAQGQQQIDQSIQSLSEVMKQLAEPMATQEQQVAQAVVNLSIAIARSVIHRELHTDSSVIQALVAQVMADLPRQDAGMAIAINPKDRESVNQAIEKAGVNIKVETQNQVHPGGCIVTTSTQLIDHTIEKRFQKTVQETLLRVSQSSNVILSQESPSDIQEQSDYHPDVLDEVTAEFDASETIEDVSAPTLEASEGAGEDEEGPDEPPSGDAKLSAEQEETDPAPTQSSEKGPEKGPKDD